jgi:hypothetical protein
MKSILSPLLLSFAVLTISSCKKSNPVSSSSSSGQILPLETGNTWVYRYTDFDTSGAAYATGYDTLVVGRDTFVGNDTWYQIRLDLWTNKSDGAWQMAMVPDSLAPTLVFKYPADVGETWTPQVDPWDTCQVSVQANNTSMTVPKGTYTCYQYRWVINSHLMVDDYMCPGMGLIAMDTYLATSSGRAYRDHHEELVSAIIK